MYFSLITPSPGQERDAAHDWARNAYEEHQWLWRFLPAPPGSTRNVEFRRRDADGLPRFYVVSDRAPHSPTPHWQVQSRPYAPSLYAGDQLAFELHANPVVTVKSAQGKAARHDVVMQAKTLLLKERQLAHWADWTTPDRPSMPELVQQSCQAWMLARCERLGITLDGDALSVDGYEQHRGKRGELRFSTVDFSGRMTVVDPAALHSALMSGVGHAKAFGCGLLLIRPIG